MKCIGVRENYRVYYDCKHDEYLLMNPNFRFNRRFEHASCSYIVEWAINCRDKHREKIKSGELKHRET